MKPGVELDALIAEKVTGLDVREVAAQFPIGHGDFAEEKVLVVSNGPMLEDLPCYSTDIAAAWQVVERVHDVIGKWILVKKYSDRQYVAYEATECADPDWGSFCEYAETAPLAICLAALAAVGHPLPQEGH